MITRLQRIRTEFGAVARLKTLLLLAGLVGMAIMELAWLEGFAATAVAAAGLVLGYVLREAIVRCALVVPLVVRLGLVVYAFVLFFGKRVGMDAEWKLLVIALTTVVIFDLQFWSLSDPRVVNRERE